MRRVALIVLLSITAALAADKDKIRFTVKPAAEYLGSQTVDKITVAAVPYSTPEQAATAFGKVNPNQHGVLPVLVVIQNDTGKALRLDLKVQFVDSENHNLDAVPPEDVVTIDAIRNRQGQPRTPPWPPIPTKPKKGPLNIPEI